MITVSKDNRNIKNKDLKTGKEIQKEMKRIQKLQEQGKLENPWNK